MPFFKPKNNIALSHSSGHGARPAQNQAPALDLPCPRCATLARRLPVRGWHGSSAFPAGASRLTSRFSEVWHPSFALLLLWLTGSPQRAVRCVCYRTIITASIISFAAAASLGVKNHYLIYRTPTPPTPHPYSRPSLEWIWA